jgi:hypothetical protein
MSACAPLLCLLLAFAPHVSDAGETEEARTERLTDVYEAVVSATDDPDEQAWLLMTGDRESHWAGYIYRDESRCRDGIGGRCDGGKAWSFWQLHGTDRRGGVTVAARVAIKTFRLKANYCRARGFDYWVGGTSLYATGKTCSWPEATERVRQAQSIAGGLRK